MTGQIIAATFTVIFEGLVAVVGETPTQKTHVAVVSASRHEAYILANGVRTDLAKGDVVSFDLNTGEATTTESFDRRIPDIADYLLAGDLHDDVKDQTHPNDGVLAFVTLAQGSLSAEGGFAYPAVFTKRDGSKDIRCIARSVRFDAESGGDVAITINGPTRATPVVFTVPASSYVYVGNISMTAGMHFHGFAGLLNRRGKLGPTSELSTDCGADGSLDARPHPGADRRRQTEARSRITPLIPNGDCGPVDYP